MEVTDYLVLALMCPEEEIWAPIAGFPGYEVSSWGRVRSYWKLVPLEGRRGSCTVLCDTPQNYLKPSIHSGDGRLQYGLYRGGRRHTKQLAAWILLSFEGPKPGPKWDCAHRNGVNTDNRLENLRWSTRSENQIDRVYHRTNPIQKLSHSDIPVIRSRLAAGESQAAIAKTYGVVPVTISLIKRGVTWSHVA